MGSDPNSNTYLLLYILRPSSNPPPYIFTLYLGPSINGLVTDGNTKLCCRGLILALFQSTTANKIDFKHTQGYKRLLPVCDAEILRGTVKKN